MFGVLQPNPNRGFGDASSWRIESWSKEQIATFADYMTINPGDLIFFFLERMIYGSPRPSALMKLLMVNVHNLNYRDSHLPSPSKPRDGLITRDDDENWLYARVVVPFVPSPLKFEDGIDTDEALAASGCEFFWGFASGRGSASSN